ncbi:MAG: efflux RND transporter permease subunit [Gammaproteobacteria bacterium]|nr:efflux RND transporter permease subunit [Gammaproteobacteria bacterium]
MPTSLFQQFLQHHVLANLTFILILVMGFLSYTAMPKEKDPSMNFNWIQINTILMDASPEDIEKRITDPLEEGIAKVSDIRFISSSSRESMSSILVRFEDLDERAFDKRVADLRREIQHIENTRLPEESESPLILELTSSSAFPTATLVLQGQAYDENLRFYAQAFDKEMERLSYIERVDLLGSSDPELIVEVDLERLTGLGLSPAIVAQTIQAQFKDTAAGTMNIEDQQWLISVKGTSNDPEYLAKLPILGIEHQVLLGDVAKIYMGQDKLSTKSLYNNRPAIILSVFKKDNINTLKMIDDLKIFIEQKNQLTEVTGIAVTLLDDNTLLTRKAMDIMQNNALIGLFLVLFVTWFFLGTRIAIFTTIGIPFTLSATFWILHALGLTLNNAVLLGVVIVLGMLVDDAIVVVESMYTRMRHGVNTTLAAIEAIKEVISPVTASVLTTMAAFLPLMLLPGIIGKFMLVIPLVVTIALAISLIEAYWMLPAHIIASNPVYSSSGEEPKKNHMQIFRESFTHKLKIVYIRLLIGSLRRPKIMLLSLILLFCSAIYALKSGEITVNFFEGEPFPLIYVNVKMQEGTPIDYTLRKVNQLENNIKLVFERSDYREMASYAGFYFTQVEPLFGEHYGQIIISLPDTSQEKLKILHKKLNVEFSRMTGVEEVSLLQLEDGPPVSRAISMKVQGSEFRLIQDAVADLKQIFEQMGDIENVTILDSAGTMELALQLNQDAVHRAGIPPNQIMRDIRLLAGGEIVSSFQYRGEEVNIRVKAGLNSSSKLQEDKEMTPNMISSWLQTPISFFDQQTEKVLSIPLSELVQEKYQLSRSNIRHYNLQRVVLVEADIKKGGPNTLEMNRLIQESWQKIKIKHPGISLDFSGQLDDLKETLDVMPYLFLMGVGLIYLIIGTQFRSYFQPLLIIATIPLAFTGVVIGLFLTKNPLSLYTLYGIVALVGIAVNASIVLISAANTRLRQGMSVNHAIIFAARRRIIPILITSLTTIAGLFSLASGFAGKSLIWGPLATAIVWGLAFSTMLTLFVIPLLYKFFMKPATLKVP